MKNRKQDYDNHKKNATVLDCSQCERRFCHQQAYDQHLRTDHVVRRDLSLIERLSDPICPRTGHENMPGFVEQVRRNASRIKTTSKWSGTATFTVSREINPNFTYGDLKYLLASPLEICERAYKINLGFSVMLYHTVRKEYKLFYCSTNTMLFDKAYAISQQSDIDDLMKKILEIDVLETYYQQRPSSGWVVAAVPNVTVKVFLMENVLIGAGGVILPENLKKLRCLQGLENDKHGKPYTDHFCFFRCLSLHLGHDIIALERPTKELVARYEKHTGKSAIKVVKIDNLAVIEQLFQLNMCIP